MINSTITNWRKARSSSTDGGTDCVETGWTASVVGYRDSKQPAGSELQFPTAAAQTFIMGVRGGGLIHT